MADTELLGKRRKRSTLFAQALDGSHIILGYFGLAIGFAVRMALALYSVGNVVRARAYFEVLDIATLAIVAFVPNDKFRVGDFAMVEFIHISVCQDVFLDADFAGLAVPLRV